MTRTAASSTPIRTLRFFTTWSLLLLVLSLTATALVAGQ
uniref:Uncharacterized protein n=1 Tax=Zea mays TaxID=4577 RepID=B6U044_MAIZE|nr:hypothetical protein [Zea mays]